MERLKKKIYDMEWHEQLMVLNQIAAKIYIARNITLDQDTIIEQLKLIDQLYFKGGTPEDESGN